MLDKVLKFGKHKGKTWEQLLKTEEGRSWISWYLDQPIREDLEENIKQYDLKLRKTLKEKMEMFKALEEDTPEEIKPKKTNSPTQITLETIDNKLSILLQESGEIRENLVKLLDVNDIAWDENK